ncbi:MAG: ABC transporter substrate-binding protein [Candidatus Heimdallarchaeota archaeon]
MIRKPFEARGFQSHGIWGNNLSPMCPKKPMRNRSFLGAFPGASPRTMAVLLILILITLSGGLFLTSQVGRNKRGAIAKEDPELPEPLFSVDVLTARTNAYGYSAARSLIENLPKIGIGVRRGSAHPGPSAVRSLVQDSTNERLSSIGDWRSDLTFLRWPHDPLGHWSFSNYYSFRVNGENPYPINLTTLDATLENLDVAASPEQRRLFLLQAYNLIIWDIHAVTAIGETLNPFALDADIRQFDADRWALGLPNLAEMYYASSGQTTFSFGSPNNPQNLNPALAFDYDVFWYSYDSHDSWYRINPHTAPDYVSQPIFSKLFEYDATLTLKPLLAAVYPLAIGAHDLVPSSGISQDSPYAGKEGTAWGPNPAINATQYDPYVTAANESMFLLRLREGLPWQPGYGYTAEMKLNVTADDLIWTFSYYLNDELSSPHRSAWRTWFGSNYSKAIEKLNETTVKINFHGPLGDGQVADWLEILAINPLPRHILDPAYGPGLLNLGRLNVSLTPDRTMILPYARHDEYRFNTGAGDTPVVACGPYYLEGVVGSQSYDRVFTLKKFDDWGGRGAASFWNEEPFSKNNIETYRYTRYTHMEDVLLAFGAESADGIELYNLDYGNRGNLPAFDNQLAALKTNPNVTLQYTTAPSQLVVAFDVSKAYLANRLVRLAISHALPRETIMNAVDSEQGIANELLGIPRTSPDYPREEEWLTIGPSEPLNVTGRELSGHLTYDLEAAWALMELAGYDMKPFREYASEKPPEQTKTNGIALAPYSIILAMVVFATIRFRSKLRKYRSK